MLCALSPSRACVSERTNMKENELSKIILDAAIEVIAQKGFFHSRVSEIAGRVGKRQMIAEGFPGAVFPVIA